MISNYKILKKLGEGASSNIFLTENILDKKQYSPIYFYMLI